MKILQRFGANFEEILEKILKKSRWNFRKDVKTWGKICAEILENLGIATFRKMLRRDRKSFLEIYEYFGILTKLIHLKIL